ncbi:MAG: hypothetical protein RR330_02210 [Alistipes sp.]
MKLNIVRQPLIVAILLLLVATLCGFARFNLLPSSSEMIASSHFFLGQYVHGLQVAWPQLSVIACVVLTLLTGLTLGRMGARFALYANVSSLTLSLYGILACNLFIGQDYLIGSIVAFLLARGLSNFCNSYRNGYTFDKLFRGAVYIGLLPLFSPETLPLLLLVPWGVLIFKRTIREVVVAFAGLSVALLATCYLSWGSAVGFFTPLSTLFHAFITHSGLHLLQGISPVLLAFLGLVLFLTICAMLFFFGDHYSLGSKARAVLTFDLGVLLICGTLFFVPCSTATLFAWIAVPVSLLLPFFFVRIRANFSFSLYLTLLLLCIARFWY